MHMKDNRQKYYMAHEYASGNNILTYLNGPIHCECYP